MILGADPGVVAPLSWTGVVATSPQLHTLQVAALRAAAATADAQTVENNIRSATLRWMGGDSHEAVTAAALRSDSIFGEEDAGGPVLHGSVSSAEFQLWTKSEPHQHQRRRHAANNRVAVAVAAAGASAHTQGLVAAGAVQADRLQRGLQDVGRLAAVGRLPWRAVRPAHELVRARHNAAVQAEWTDIAGAAERLRRRRLQSQGCAALARRLRGGSDAFVPPADRFYGRRPHPTRGWFLLPRVKTKPTVVFFGDGGGVQRRRRGRWGRPAVPASRIARMVGHSALLLRTNEAYTTARMPCGHAARRLTAQETAALPARARFFGDMAKSRYRRCSEPTCALFGVVVCHRDHYGSICIFQRGVADMVSTLPFPACTA